MNFNTYNILYEQLSITDFKNTCICGFSAENHRAASMMLLGFFLYVYQQNVCRCKQKAEIKPCTEWYFFIYH